MDGKPGVSQCSNCVYSLFRPLNVCLSPKERVQRDGNWKAIYADSECHNGDFTQRQDGRLKRVMFIQRAKDVLTTKEK